MKQSEIEALFKAGAHTVTVRKGVEPDEFTVCIFGNHPPIEANSAHLAAPCSVSGTTSKALEQAFRTASEAFEARVYIGTKNPSVKKRPATEWL